MRQNPTHMIKSFTAWRGLAVLFVCLYHWFPHTVQGGYLGVIIFLTLSGYLVTDSFLSELELHKKISIIRFYVRRIKRLYPPMILFMLVATLWANFLNHDLLYNFSASAFSTLFGVNNWWQISQNLSYFQHFALPDMFTHMWALAVEMQIYLFWPFVVWIVGKLASRAPRRALLRASLIGAAVSAVLLAVMYQLSIHNITRAYYGSDTRVFSFLLGSALACRFSRQTLVNWYQRARTLDTYKSLLACIITVLCMIFLAGDTWFAYYGGMVLFNVVLLVAMATSVDESGLSARLIGNPVLMYLGKRSYSLYLWQYTLWAFGKAGFNPPGVSYGSAVIMQAVFLLILAELTYQISEKHLMALVNWCAPSALHKNQAHSRGKMLVLLAFSALIACFAWTCIHAPVGAPEDVREMQSRLADDDDENARTTTNDTQQSDENASQQEEEDGTAGTTPYEKPDNINQFDKVIAQYPELGITKEEATLAHNIKIFAVGDSVLKMCRKQLGKILPNMTIDATNSRQIPAGLNILRELKHSDNFPDVVYFALGTNGIINDDMLDSLSAEFSDTDIYISTVVSNDSYEHDVNDYITRAVKRHDNLHLIDWHQFAKDKTELFYTDGTHPNIGGSEVYAQFVAKSILQSQQEKSSS